MINKLYNKAILFCLLLSFGLNQSLEAQKSDFIPEDEFAEVFETLRKSKEEGKPIRILHLGDSHIKKGFCTDPIRDELQKRYGVLVKVEPMGINGATYVTFSSSEKIKEIVNFEPDLMIVSLGTNDSYSNRFSSAQMEYNMEVFFTMLEEEYPNLPIILTTPPASYFKHRKRIRRRRYSTYYTYNKQTAKASRTLKYLARSRNFGVIDLYERYGSQKQTQSWLRQGLMRKDHVHYSAQAYNKFGKAIAEALIKFVEGSKPQNQTS